MRLFELAYACHVYGQVTGFDKSLSQFRQQTGPAVDLASPAHRVAVLKWLNAWGCRQFAIEHHLTASESLIDWSQLWVSRLPPSDVRLDTLAPVDLDMAAEAYGDLKERTASMRTRSGRTVRVTFGPTGAAKTMFILRPHAFPPWDEPIRAQLGYDGSPDSYRRFLLRVVEEAKSAALEAGVSIADLPSLIGRPDSSAAEMIDEYYWMVLTRGLTPPSAEQLSQWCAWAG